MKKNIVFILFSVIASVLSGQQVYLEMGKTLSSFDYTNSSGNSLDNLLGSTHNFMKIGYHTESFVEQLNYSVGLTLNGYGAKGSDEILDNYFDWDVSCLGLEFGVDYDLFKKRFATKNISDFSVYLKASFAPEFTVRGSQTINDDVYNLVGVEQFKYPFLFVRGGGGISYSVSRSIAAYFQYMGGLGFPVKSGSGDEEKLKIAAHNLGFGLLINLPSSRVNK